MTFSAELCTAPIFTCAGFMATLNCQMRCPTVSVRLRLTVNCALIPSALGFAKITHCAWPLLSGEVPWNDPREELTVYARGPATGVPSGYLKFSSSDGPETPGRISMALTLAVCTTLSNSMLTWPFETVTSSPLTRAALAPASAKMSKLDKNGAACILTLKTHAPLACVAAEDSGK